MLHALKLYNADLEILRTAIQCVTYKPSATSQATPVEIAMDVIYASKEVGNLEWVTKKLEGSPARSTILFTTEELRVLYSGLSVMEYLNLDDGASIRDRFDILQRQLKEQL